MLESIYLPENITIDEDGDNQSTISIYPYHPGYGPTVGNALRRVLLSSLPGAAITHMKIEGADHEFSAIDGVKEDLVSIVLNLKKVNVSSESAEPVEIKLKVDGEKKVFAKDFETPPGVEITNGDQLVFTTTDKKAKVEMTCRVEQGRGYAVSEITKDDQRDIGTIGIDAIFTPVERVSFHVENVRVGQDTDYHKLVLTIATDGSISPRDALSQAASILADHFKELTEDAIERLTAVRPEPVKETSITSEEDSQPENTLNLLQLPSRVHNALERVGITTVEQVIELSDEQIQDVPGLGEKAVQDIIDSRNGYLAAMGSEESSEEETDKNES